MSATKLSLAQLIDCARIAPARGGCGCHGGGMAPKCYWYNEIGLVFEAGGDESAQAEEHLRGILTVDDEDQRYVAYCYLKGNPSRISPATLAALDQFEADPKNTDLNLLWSWQHAARVFDKRAEGADEAEETLRGLLTHEDERARRIAGLVLLRHKDRVSPATQSALEAYQAVSDNAHLVSRIMADLDHERRMAESAISDLGQDSVEA